MSTPQENTTLRTGELARLAGVGIETLRFYERKGLLPKPPRQPSGYRAYPQETVQRLNFIKSAQHLGFSLREIRELLQLGNNPQGTCEEVRQRAEAKIDEIELKIHDLHNMRNALHRLAELCRDSDGLNADQPIPCLAALFRAPVERPGAPADDGHTQ